MAKKQRVRREARERGRRSPKAESPVRRPRQRIELAATRGSRQAVLGARSRDAAALDTVDVTLALRDVHGDLIHDPEGIFTFRRQKDGRQIADQARLALRGTAVRIGIPAGGDVVQCDIDLQRYRFTRSPLFMRAAGFPRTFDGPLVREPEEWRPTFTRWAELPGAFEALRTVLSGSNDLTILGTNSTLASLAGDAYDAVSGVDTVLAKTALLNIYYRLRTTGPPIVGAESWFSFVDQIIAVGRERFLAWVKPGMARAVREILDDLDNARDDFERADPALHRKNVPAALQPRITNMFSLKSTHDKGNYQLTLVELSGADAVLLDADIDESGTFWGHARDLFKHKVSGGTHPVDVHEILVRQDHARPDFDLGYTLV